MSAIHSTLRGARVPERVSKIHRLPGVCWRQHSASLSCIAGSLAMTSWGFSIRDVSAQQLHWAALGWAWVAATLAHSELAQDFWPWHPFFFFNIYNL